MARQNAIPRIRRFPFFQGALLLAWIVSSVQPEPAWGKTRPALPQSKENGSQKIHLTSDHLEYLQEEGTYFAEGNAVLTQGSMRLKVNTLWFNDKTKQLKGEGDVAFSDNGNTIEASRIELNLLTEQGVLLDGKIFFAEENYSLSGKRIERLRADHFDLHQASFTACDCVDDRPDWRIRAQRLRVTLRNYLVAKNLFFYIQDVPVFYLPYWIYPIKTDRQSGFLIPHLGYSSKHGFRYNQDLFLALGQSRDMTLSFDSRGQKGKGGGLEYRYALSKETRGTLQTDLFEDIEKETDFVSVRYRHRQRLSDRVLLRLDAHYVNEGGFFSELSDWTPDRALRRIESNGSVTYRGDESVAYLLARYTQDLTSLHNDKPLQRLPEVGWSLMAHPLGPFYFSGEATYTRFLREETGLAWERLDLFPTVSLPMRLSSAIALTPWYGARPVGYSHTAQTSDPFYRNARVKGVRLNSEWKGRAGGRLSNALLYEQVDAEDRSDVFAADDVDRIHSRESITLSLNPRLLTRESDLLASIRLTETYHIEPIPSSSNAYSDLRGELSLRPSSALALKIDTFYDWEAEEITALNTDLHFHSKERVRLSIGERFTRGGTLSQKGDLFNPLYLGDRLPSSPIEFITARLLINPRGSIRLATQVYYDKERDKPIELHYGLLYLKQCWSVTLAYQELPDDRNETFFIVHLKGLGAALPKRFSYLFDF